MIHNKLDALREVRHEIRRLNEAAGETVFNPAATQLLDELIDEELAEEGAEVVADICAGKY